MAEIIKISDIRDQALRDLAQRADEYDAETQGFLDNGEPEDGLICEDEINNYLDRAETICKGYEKTVRKAELDGSPTDKPFEHVFKLKPQFCHVDNSSFYDVKRGDLWLKVINSGSDTRSTFRFSDNATRFAANGMDHNGDGELSLEEVQRSTMEPAASENAWDYFNSITDPDQHSKLKSVANVGITLADNVGYFAMRFAPLAGAGILAGATLAEEIIGGRKAGVPLGDRALSMGVAFAGRMVGALGARVGGSVASKVLVKTGVFMQIGGAVAGYAFGGWAGLNGTQGLANKISDWRHQKPAGNQPVQKSDESSLFSRSLKLFGN